MELQKLTRCEQKIMVEIWRSGEADARSVMHNMENQGTSWKPTTVSTLLARLVKKGYLERYRQGRKIFYIPKIESTVYAKKLQEEYEEFCRNAGVEGCLVVRKLQDK